MIRRFGVVLLLVLLPLLATETPLFSAPLKERDVKKLLEEYLKADTSEDRRTEILKTLKPEEPALAQKTLKSALKNETQRPLALKAAVTLKTGGLFKSVEDYIDSEDEQAIIELLLVTEDEDGIKLLVERLQTLEQETASYKFTLDGFTTLHLSAKALEPFRKCLKDKVRVEETLAILRFQFDKPELTAENALSQWAALGAESDRNYRTWKVEGINVLTLEGWESEGTVPYGENLMIGPSAWMNFKDAPDSLKKDSKLTIKLRTVVLEGTGGNYSLSFGSWNTSYTPFIKDDKWITKDVDGSVYTSAPLKKGVWQEHVWEISPQKDGTRKITLFIDGKELIGGAASADPLYGFLVKGEGAKFLIGGFQAIVGQ